MIALAELQRRIDSGDLSPDAAISLSLDAIGTHERTIGAFVCHAENARAQNAGPLRGIAVGIKDIIDTANFPTEMAADLQGIPAARPRTCRGCAEAGGRDHHRQDHDHGFCGQRSDCDA
jgi:hypothetical protein